ncbi:MAG: hypothetical protein AAF561_01730 [Planctomycetota bacterium]
MAPDHPSLRADDPERPIPAEPKAEVTPWDERPRRRVATTLGDSRARPRPQPTDDDDGQFAVAFDDSAADRRRGVGRDAGLRRLEPLFRRVRPWSLATFFVVALIAASAAGVGVVWLGYFAVELPSITRVIAPDALVFAPAALVVLTLLCVYVAAAGLATPFAATLGVTASAWWIVTAGEPVSLVSFGLAATLAATVWWWRSGNWFHGLSAGIAATATTLIEPTAGLAIVLPMTVLAAGWAWRRPLRSAIAASAPLAGVLVVGTNGLLRVGPSELVSHFAGVEETLQLAITGFDVLAVPQMQLILAGLAVATLASRSVPAALFLALAAGVATFTRQADVLPVLGVATAIVLAGVHAGRRRFWTSLVSPILVGGVAVGLMLLTATSVVDPTSRLLAEEQADAIADLAAGRPVVVDETIDDSLVTALADRVEMHAPSVVDEPSFLLVTSELDRRTHERALRSADPTVRTDVVLRWADATADSVRTWVVVSVTGRRSGMSSPELP